jgi:hypothetical protein
MTTFSRLGVSAATNGAQFFVAWEESRAALPIRFRTYRDDGGPQQALPLAAPGFLGGPAVVWNGKAWIVVSATQPVDVAGAETPSLFGVVVHESGDVDGNGVVMASSLNSSGIAAIAWNGSVAIASNGASTVTAAGDASVLHQGPAGYVPLASVGGTFLVGEPSPSTTACAILDGNGALVRHVQVTGGVLAATAHGDEYALAIKGDANRLTLLLLDAGGNIKATTSYDADLQNVSRASMAWSGGSYVVALGHYSADLGPSKGLCLLRAEGLGTTTCMASWTSILGVALAANDTTLLAVWTEVAGNVRVMTSFSAAGALPAEETATEATTLTQPQIAQAMETDPNGVTAVWLEPDTTTSARVMVGGIDRSGLRRTPRLLGASAQDAVRLARGAASTMAVWATGGNSPQIYAREIADTGTLGPPLLIGNGFEPAVAFDGDDWLVVWRSLGPLPQVMTALVRGQQQTDVPIVRTLSPSTNTQYEPVVASRGSDFFVVWQEQGSFSLGQKCAFVDRGGMTASASMTLTPSRLLASSFAWGMDVAANGTGYLVAVVTNGDPFSLVPSSPIPDVLVSGVQADPGFTGPNPNHPRVRPRANGGFAILFSSTLGEGRFTTISARGEVTSDTMLPYGRDFLETNGAIDVLYTPDNSLGAVYFDTFTMRRRAVGLR